MTVSGPSGAFAHATKLISGRDKTAAQVREALERKGFSRDEIDAAIERCRELKYLDDARVAKRLALEALNDGWVGDALLGKLSSKGLDERTAHDAIMLAREELGFVDRSVAMGLLTKRKLEGAKAARFLASRGFPEELVEQLVGSE